MAFSCLFPYKLSTVVENSFPLKTSCSLWVNTYSETNIFTFQSEIHPERRGQQRWPPACSLCQAPEVWISSEVKQLRFNVFFVNSESHYFLLSVPLSSSAEFKWGKKREKEHRQAPLTSHPFLFSHRRKVPWIFKTGHFGDYSTRGVLQGYSRPPQKGRKGQTWRNLKDKSYMLLLMSFLKGKC